MLDALAWKIATGINLFKCLVFKKHPVWTAGGLLLGDWTIPEKKTGGLWGCGISSSVGEIASIISRV